MSLTVPSSPVTVELCSADTSRPIVVRAHARKRATFRYTARMAEADRMDAIDDKRARMFALFDEFLAALESAPVPGIVATDYRIRIASAAVMP